MANTKHKNHQAISPKIVEAQHRNEFILLFSTWLNTFAEEKVSHLIPKHHYEAIYKARFHPIKIINSPTSGHINKATLDEFKEFNTAILKVNYIDIELNNGETKSISFHLYFTVCFTIYLYVKGLTEKDFKEAHHIITKLHSTIQCMEEELYPMVLKRYQELIYVNCMLHNHFQSQLISYHLELKIDDITKSGPRYYIFLSGIEPEKTTIAIEELPRPIYRLGIPVHGTNPSMQYITIAPEQLQLKSTAPLSVYIQSHAFHRLSERIDGIYDGILLQNIYDSFSNIVFQKDNDDNYLFEFTLNRIKVGYFKAVIIDNLIVLQTFLFLTNNGTPEGKKLHQNNGIMKEDKIYLAIDKLSTFVKSDIANNPTLKQLFIDAGCESLFQIDRSFFYEDSSTKTIANYITHYLKLDEK